MRDKAGSIAETAVSPRFEVFYALQALETGVTHRLDAWLRETERRLPARLRTNLADVAPSPLIWPLLADALRDEPASISFTAMMQALREMDEETFQRSVLGGAFKTPGAVDRLVSGRASLAETVRKEAPAQERLLSLLGLHPFARRAPSAVAFERMVSKAASYREEVVTVLESFWAASFSDTWVELEPQMRKSASGIKRALSAGTFASFASGRKLPVTIEGNAIVTIRTGDRFSLKSVKGVYLIPSAFNTAGLWAAYSDPGKRKRYFIPILDTALAPGATARVDAAAVFKALGDTTRYGIATLLARTPMTSVELARAFGVSKPTISHHMHELRAAGLIAESQTPRGILLSLNRAVLEEASGAAAHDMFTGEPPGDAIRRSRRANKT